MREENERYTIFSSYNYILNVKKASLGIRKNFAHINQAKRHNNPFSYGLSLFTLAISLLSMSAKIGGFFYIAFQYRQLANEGRVKTLTGLGCPADSFIIDSQQSNNSWVYSEEPKIAEGMSIILSYALLVSVIYIPAYIRKIQKIDTSPGPLQLAEENSCCHHSPRGEVCKQTAISWSTSFSAGLALDSFWYLLLIVVGDRSNSVCGFTVEEEQLSYFNTMANMNNVIIWPIAIIILWLLIASAERCKRGRPEQCLNKCIENHADDRSPLLCKALVLFIIFSVYFFLLQPLIHFTAFLIQAFSSPESLFPDFTLFFDNIERASYDPFVTFVAIAMIDALAIILAIITCATQLCFPPGLERWSREDCCHHSQAEDQIGAPQAENNYHNNVRLRARRQEEVELDPEQQSVFVATAS